MATDEQIREKSGWLKRQLTPTNVLLSALLAIVAFIGAYMFDTIQALPQTYCTISAAEQSINELKEQISDVRASQRRETDELREALCRVEAKIDKLLLYQLEGTGDGGEKKR